MTIAVDLTVTNLVFLGVVVVALKKLFHLLQTWRMEQIMSQWDHSPKDKVILHSVWRCKTLPSLSPFALKLETYLRMAKIPYEMETNNMVGPKGKIPWITYNGTHMADSHLIIQFLNKKLSVNLNKHLSTEQISIAKACRIILEDHFLWGILQYRYMENASALPQLLNMPPLVRYLMPLRCRQFKNRMHDHGIGQHTPTEIYHITEDDLHTVSNILGNKKFLGGEEPGEDDCAVFGFLSQVVWGMPGSSFERLAHGDLSNLKQYCDRMKDKYWPDWDDCMDKN